MQIRFITCTVYPKKYAHGFVVFCFVVVMQSFIMNSHEVFIHIHLGCFAGTGAIVRLPQCQWSKPDGYGKISQCITTTKHSKAKTVCIFLGIYCVLLFDDARSRVLYNNQAWCWHVSSIPEYIAQVGKIKWLVLTLYLAWFIGVEHVWYKHIWYCVDYIFLLKCELQWWCNKCNCIPLIYMVRGWL